MQSKNPSQTRATGQLGGVNSYKSAIMIVAGAERLQNPFEAKRVLDERIKSGVGKLLNPENVSLAVALPRADTTQNNREDGVNLANDHVHSVSLVSRSLLGHYSVNESVNESRGKSVSDTEIKKKGVLSFFTKDESLVYWRFQKHGKRRAAFNCLWGYMYDKARAGVKWATPPVDRLKAKLGCKSIRGVYHFLDHLDAIGVLKSEPYDRKAGRKRIRWAIPSNIWQMANGTYGDNENPF